MFKLNTQINVLILIYSDDWQKKDEREGTYFQLVVWWWRGNLLELAMCVQHLIAGQGRKKFAS